jgi:hypothetical protein
MDMLGLIDYFGDMWEPPPYGEDDGVWGDPTYGGGNMNGGDITEMDRFVVNGGMTFGDRALDAYLNLLLNISINDYTADKEVQLLLEESLLSSSITYDLRLTAITETWILFIGIKKAITKGTKAERNAAINKVLEMFNISRRGVKSFTYKPKLDTEASTPIY